jgi:hypothetical protein
MNTHKLKNDRFRNSRGGQARFCNIICRACGATVLLYQKDGIGALRRCYLNRIFEPPGLAALQSNPVIREPRDLPPLRCTCCNSIVGFPMQHSDGRLAFRLKTGAFIRQNRRI